MKLVRYLLAESIMLFAAGIIASCISGAAAMGVVVVLFHIIGSAWQMPWGWFAGLAVVALAARVLSRRLIGHLGREALFRIRVTLARQIVNAPLIELEQTGNARLVASLTEDVGRIAGVLPNLVFLTTNATMLAAFVGYLGWLSPTHLMIVAAIIAIGTTAHLALRREGTRQSRISRERWQDMFESFRALVGGMKEIKLNAARREWALDAFSRRAWDLKESGRRQSLFFGTSGTLTQALFYLAIGLALVEFAEMNTSRIVTVGYVVSIIYLMAPLQAIVDILQSLVQANIAMGRIEELGVRLDQARAGYPHEDEGAKEVVTTLELEAVEYGYGPPEQREFALKPVSLMLNAGEIVFVVGGNGSGKTTFAKLLTGLYTPTAGAIAVNGRRVGDADHAWYRQQFSAIFHDFYLFEQLIATDAEGDACEAEASALLQRLHISDRLKIEDGRLCKTATLSVGERKRVALMLAFLEDRPICLFDEWAADQDAIFKDIFYREILSELRGRGKLVIVISHDDRYFDVADKLLILERGLPPVVLRGNAARDAIGARGDGRVSVVHTVT